MLVFGDELNDKEDAKIIEDYQTDLNTAEICREAYMHLLYLGSVEKRFMNRNNWINSICSQSRRGLYVDLFTQESV